MIQKYTHVLFRCHYASKSHMQGMIIISLNTLYNFLSIKRDISITKIKSFGIGDFYTFVCRENYFTTI